MCNLEVENLEANTEVEISLSAKSNHYTNLVTFWVLPSSDFRSGTAEKF